MNLFNVQWIGIDGEPAVKAFASFEKALAWAKKEARKGGYSLWAIVEIGATKDYLRCIKNRLNGALYKITKHCI